MTGRLIRGLILGLAAGLIGLLLTAAGLTERFENITWDWRVRLFAKPSPFTDRIKIIALDQASLDWAEKEFGLSWPWPRQVYAPILEFLGRAGAKVVAFDVLFTEPSNIQGDDAAFGRAIAAGPPFIGAMALGEHAGLTTAWPDEPTVPIPPVAGLKAWLETAGTGATASRALLPIPEVTTKATFIGNVGEAGLADQVIRRVGLFRVFDGRAVPAPGLAAYVAASGERLKLVPGALMAGETIAPIDSDGRAILNFRGPPGTHQKFSAAAVIQSELRLREGRTPPIEDPAVFKDAVVLFGLTAPGLSDLKASAVAAVHAGVEIHATVIDNLLAGDFIASPSGWAAGGAGLALALLAGLAVSIGTRPRHTVSAWLICLPLPVLLALNAYRLGLWWPLIGSEAAVLIALIGGMGLNYATEGRQRRFIKKAFKHYLSPAVIDQILKNPNRLELGGERRELTIFFSDLEGFTSISEGLDPADLAALLNEYLSDMTDIILEAGGVVDKYEGDAIIAFWNAPLDQPDHAERAVRAALRCQKKLRDRRDEFQKRYGATLRMRIGLNTGPVVVGNLGSASRFDYTVLGDAANLASRLEGANKVFGTYTMVSESTWRAAGDKFIGRELGRLIVVGKKQAVRVFEPLGEKGEESPETARRFEAALALLRAGETSRALAAFEELADDPAARAYAERCRLVLKEAGEQTWDGVWNLTSK